MAELQEQMLQEGQELQTSSVNRMGAAALIDDRLLADLLRAPLDESGVAKLVLPYGQPDQTNGAATVAPSGSSDGKVAIWPFRAVVGSRSQVLGGIATDGMAAWRDIRSAVFVGGADPTTVNPVTTIVATQQIADNSSGNARWDAIYAAITPDAAAVTAARAVKSPTTGVVTTPTTTVAVGTKVSIGYAEGTPSANPALPAVPTDAAGVYYVALAYVLVPDGFNSGWPVKSWMILSVASPGPAALSKALGGANLSAPNSATQSTAALAAWANVTGQSTTSGRPHYLLPPEGPRGQESLVVQMAFDYSGVAAWSHTMGALIDNSRDWRQRFFRSFIFTAPSASIQISHFASSRDAVLPGQYIVPDWAGVSGDEAMAGHMLVRFGQSFRTTSANFPGGDVPGGSGFIVWAATSTTLGINSGACVGVYVDSAGALRAYVTGAPQVNVFAWIDSTGPMPNY